MIVHYCGTDVDKQEPSVAALLHRCHIAHTHSKADRETDTGTDKRVYKSSFYGQTCRQTCIQIQFLFREGMAEEEKGRDRKLREDYAPKKNGVIVCVCVCVCVSAYTFIYILRGYVYMHSFIRKGK